MFQLVLRTEDAAAALSAASKKVVILDQPEQLPFNTHATQYRKYNMYDIVCIYI